MNKVLSFHKRFRSRPGLWLLCAFAMLSLLLVTSARSQNCVGCSSFASSAEPASEQAWVIRKQVNEVSVFFTASARGKLIPDLTKEDLNIRDDNQLPAAIV